ncbi:MAG: hypothetical protein AVDCRST_MAG60-1746, partial [uncultured Nocardioides sp.]
RCCGRRSPTTRGCTPTSWSPPRRTVPRGPAAPRATRDA